MPRAYGLISAKRRRGGQLRELCKENRSLRHVNPGLRTM